MKKILFIIAIVTLALWIGSCSNEQKNITTPDSHSSSSIMMQTNLRPPAKLAEATVPLRTATLSKKIIPKINVVEPPILTPSSLDKTLRPGECVSEHKNLFLPATVTPPMGDILISFDLTGSMGGELSNVKVNSINIMNAIRGVITDSKFGVISHMDYPGSFSGCSYSDMYGDAASGDYAYQLNQVITDNTTDVSNSINTLSLGWGADGPEDYSRVFYESYADAGIGFRSGAKKIVLAFLDAWPHDCAYDAIIGGSATSGPDPGRDATVGTADDLAILNVLDGMSANNVTLIPVFSGSSTSFALWDAYAKKTGGQAFQINSDGTIPGGTDIATFLAGLIQGSIKKFDKVTLQVCDPAYNSWLTSVVPAEYTNITLGTPIDLPFDIQICVPIGTLTGKYCFNICAIGDGVILAQQRVCITVVTEIDVPFDFHPTSCPNPLNVGSEGVSPAAICGTADFDVTKIDPSTLRLEGVAPIRWAYEDVCTPYNPYKGKVNCKECNTFGPDGFMDITIKFDSKVLSAALGSVVDGECRLVKITGKLKPEFGGTPISGEDVLKIIKKPVKNSSKSGSGS